MELSIGLISGNSNALFRHDTQNSIKSESKNRNMQNRI